MSQAGAAAGQDPNAGGTGGTAAGNIGDPKPGAGTIDTGTAGAGTGGAGGGQPDKPADGEPKTFSAEYVAELRREAAKHRTEAAALKEQVKKHEQVNMSEQEKLAARAKELEDQNRTLHTELRRTSAIQVATELGATVPAAVVGLIPADAEDVKAAVTAIKKQFPALFKQVPAGTADAGAGGGGQPGGAKPKSNMNDFIRRASGRNV